MAANANAYGYESLQQMMGQRLSAASVPRVLDGLREMSAEWSRASDAFLAAVVSKTTIAQERYLLPGTGTLQPLDEFGIPMPVIPSGYYDVAFPIQGGGTAAARNRVTAVLETVDDVLRDQIDAQLRDADWMVRHVLAAFFTPTSWVWPDPVAGNLTIQPLAITSDGVTYGRNGGSQTTAQHYTAQAAGIADATNPYTLIQSTLGGHPSNAGRRLVAFIASNLVASTRALATFIPVTDSDVTYGATTPRLVSDGSGLRMMGDRVLGKVGDVWIVEWARMPDGYILSLVEGRQAIAMREYPDPALQGFFFEGHSPDGARVERRYIRYAGFAVRNRIAAVVTLIGNGTYSAPAGYSAPLAV